MQHCKNILWLDPADFLGGAEIFTQDVLPLLSADFRVTVLTGAKENSAFWHNLPVTVRKESFAFPRLKPLGLGTFFAFRRTVSRLKERIVKENIDLIHSNSIRAHIIAATVIKKLPQEKKPKLSFFVHDFTFPKWTAWLFSRNADLIFACSEAVRNDLIAKGVDSRKITMIPNGVAVEKFEKLPAKPFAVSAPVIGIIGRLDPWKGQDVFLEAAEKILEEYPQARFLIFGESSAHDPKTQAFETKLRHSVVEKKLEKNVEFCGFVPATKALSQIDILIHASTAPEPFGRVIIEALAAGVPVIASSLGGAGEIFTNGVHGFSLAPGYPNLLAQKIRELLQNSELREKFSRNGKELVQEKYNLQNIVSKMKNSWHSLFMKEYS